MSDYTGLVEQAQQGTREARHAAFNELVRRFQGMAFKQAYQTLSDTHLAEDAVQEAFLTAYLRIDQLRDPAAFPGWLRRIVMTQCDRLVRGVRPTLEPIDKRYDLATGKPGPEAQVEVRDIRRIVQAAVEALPEHERAVTEGYYMQGESQKEIAERLQVPVTTVKKRLQYAREHLRLLVQDINAVFDQAIADMIQPAPEPERQPAYIRNRRERASDD
jgi:RNA polymerase sigma factor (sigma-70 family)